MGPKFGRPFKKNGVLGLCLDMDKGELSFSLDGDYMGVGYTDAALKQGPLYPAVALVHEAGCKLITGLKVPACHSH